MDSNTPSKEKPNLPKKLPKDVRRPLTLSQEFDGKLSIAGEIDFEKSEIYYTAPIQQPTLNDNNENKSDYQFFNDSAYLPNEYGDGSEYMEDESKVAYILLSESSTPLVKPRKMNLKLSETSSNSHEEASKNAETDKIKLNNDFEIDKRDHLFDLNSTKTDSIEKTSNSSVNEEDLNRTSNSSNESSNDIKSDLSESNFDTTDCKNSTITTEHNESNNVEKPRIPPKMFKSSSRNSKKSLEENTMTRPTSINEYISPSELNNYCLESFKKKLFKNEDNYVCADCKTNPSEWFSSFYFITLCSSCADIHSKFLHRTNKYHLIRINELYSEFDKSNKIKTIDTEAFFYMLHQTGNEKLNSLIEFQIEPARECLNNEGIETFIKEKYLNKKFINETDLDMSKNYLDEINKSLFKNVATPCLPLTIYYLFLGANLNMIENSKSLTDIANDSNQSYQVRYLELNECVEKVADKNQAEILSYLMGSELEGSAIQVFDLSQHKSNASKHLNKDNISIRINSNELSLLQSGSNKANSSLIRKELKTSIGYLSIIKINYLTKYGIVEIKWLDKSNNSLISTWFQCLNNFEKQNYMFEILTKILYNFNQKYTGLNSERGLVDKLIGLLGLIQSCQVRTIGFLYLINPFYYSNENENSESQVLCVLVDTLESQTENYFKRYLLIIKPIQTETESKDIFYDLLDLRKLNHVKLTDDKIIIEMPSKNYHLKSPGYHQNLSFWHETLSSLSKLNFNTFEEHYLTKDDIPLLIEKCFSYIEMNFISDKFFYFELYNKSSPKQDNKKANELYRKLLKAKEYEIKKTTPFIILNVLKLFFSKYMTQSNFELLKKIGSEIESQKANKLETVCQLLKSTDNLTFLNTLKRLCIHLRIILNFNKYNKINQHELTNLFGSILINSHFNMFDESHGIDKIIIYLIENCTQLFSLRSDYLSIQYKMVEKSINLKNIADKEQIVNTNQNSKFLLTVYLFHKHSEQSFQLNVDMNFKCKDVLIKARDEFGLYESKYWALFEVFDYEQHKIMNASLSIPADNLNPILLERILPINAKLISSLSKWSSFYLVIKYNFIQIDIERLFLTDTNYTNSLSFQEDCEVLIYCENCGSYRTYKENSSHCSHESHKKWKKAYLCVKNANLYLIKKPYCSKNKAFAEIDEDFQNQKTKQIYQCKIEECMFYYGLFEHQPGEISNKQIIYSETSEDLNKSFNLKLSSNANADVDINEEECLTLLDEKTKYAFSIHLENKEKALGRYCSLFKLAFSDKWSYFESNQMPNLKPKVPEPPRRDSLRAKTSSE